jgi:DNA-binding GntR family transcriptional regulator
MLFDSGQPRYLVLANQIGGDIRSGKYAVGDLLPPEIELCAKFGVSRHTVREAIRRLQEVGLVSRRRGVGTLVEAAAVTSRYVQSIDAIEDFWQYVKETKLHIQKRGSIKAKAAPVELPDVGRDWLTFEGYRYHGRRDYRVCWVRMYLNPRFDKIAALVAKRTEPIYALIEEIYGTKVAELQQEITAMLLPADIAGHLKAAPQSAALCSLRRYTGDDGELIEVTTNIHPADRFRYNQSLRLETPSARASASRKRP